jgi:hypothetical protein
VFGGVGIADIQFSVVRRVPKKTRVQVKLLYFGAVGIAIAGYVNGLLIGITGKDRQAGLPPA